MLKKITSEYNIDPGAVASIMDYLNENKNIGFIRSDEIEKQLEISRYHAGGCLAWLCKLEYLKYWSGKSRKKTYTVNRNKDGIVSVWKQNRITQILFQY